MLKNSNLTAENITGVLDYSRSKTSIIFIKKS